MFGPVSAIAANTPLPDLLDSEGRFLRLESSAYYDSIPNEALRLWCHQHARYGLPTRELYEWLLAEINGRFAIEVGSGSGDLAYHLGIIGTDNYQQTFPDVKALYDATEQPTIRYGQMVERLSAEEAIRKYNPQVVIASWVTQWIDPNLPYPPEGGNMYGIKEDEIIKSGITYILIGNETVHGTKKIMRLPHETFNLPFVYSRSARPDLDRIWVWNRN